MYSLFYTEKAVFPQIMAEDTGVAELRNPVFCIQTAYRCGTFARLCEKVGRKWHSFWHMTEYRETKFG